MTYKLVPYSESIDLTEFYLQAESKGFKNNSNKKMLVDSISTEKKWKIWLLKYNNKIVGSTGAHSFPEMGENSFRILCRTCVFTDQLPISRLRTKTGILTHQSVTPQFFIPTCIEWAGVQNNLYVTTNENSEGTQRLVHNIWAPMLAESKCLKKIDQIKYRGTHQTVWQLNVQEFYKQLERYPRW
jgi:hypothetical protein